MSSNRQRREPWRNTERHYCAVCNVWMGSDRQSIMLHENGKKHKQNVEKSLERKRIDKAEEEKNQKFIQASLKKMEEVALQSHVKQDGLLSSSALGSAFTAPLAHRQRQSTVVPKPQVASIPKVPPTNSKNEKREWENRKKKRLGASLPGDEGKTTPKRRKIGPGEGHYESEGKVYLEGPTFFEILEEDMKIQIWTGPVLSSLEEKRLVERGVYWKNALVAAVRKNAEKCKVHVAYLKSPSDTEETLEKNVTIDRIRIELGADKSIPDTLEEARLLAMGGELIEVSDNKAQQSQMDESTGLSGWSTVTIKRTTVRQELKEERDRLREKRKQANLERESKKKEAEARRMEEAKVANADDSALGAYDVWGTGGYKGVDISTTDVTHSVVDTAKSLATGKASVAFKKKKKKPVSSRNRRTTSADDD